MKYPFYYNMSEEDSDQEDAGKQDTEDGGYTFDGFDIEINMKVVLNPVSKPNAS